MAIKRAIDWDQAGKKFYETGCDRGVLYPYESGVYGIGSGWDGLTKVDIQTEGGEAEQKYANNHQYLNIVGTETCSGNITCYTYPEAFNACLGIKAVRPGIFAAHQLKTPFGFTFREKIENDAGAHDFKIYIIYNAIAKAGDESMETTNESPEPKELSYDFSTTPEDVPGFEPTAKFILDTRTLSKPALADIEAALYGLTGVEEFSAEKAYAVGDYVTYEEGTYKFVAQHTAGEWSTSEVVEINPEPHLPTPAELLEMVAVG